jgi:hypothetical protein
MLKTLIFILLLVAFTNPKLLKDIHFEVGVSVGPSEENTTSNDTTKTTSATTPSSQDTIPVADTATITVPDEKTKVANTATITVPDEKTKVANTATITVPDEKTKVANTATITVPDEKTKVANTATITVPDEKTKVANTATITVPDENITQIEQEHSIFHELRTTKELISKLNLKDSKTREKLEKLFQERKSNVQEDKSEIPVSQKNLSSNFIYTNSHFDFEDIINFILSIFM